MKTVLQIALGIILAVVVLGGIGFGVYVANQPSAEEVWRAKEQAKNQAALNKIKAIGLEACQKLQELGETKKAQECYTDMNKD